jgi:signal transduction histidine kinase
MDTDVSTTSRAIADLILELGKTYPFGRHGASQRVLQDLAPICGADGMILWLKMEGTRERDILFSAASWFGDSQTSFFHYLSQDSPTLRQAKDGVAANFPVSPYLSMDPRNPDAQAAASLKISTMCLVPVKWSESSWGEPGATAGVVNFYRCRPEPFSSEDFETAQFLAHSLLPLLTNISNRTALNLLKAVVRDLPPDSAIDPNAEIFSVEFKQKLERVVKLISRDFECDEVSIYLEHPNRVGHGVDLIATTWPWKTKQTLHYEPNYGLTGYCFTHESHMRIFDLRRFDEDAEIIQQNYPGSNWTKSIDLNETAYVDLDPNGIPTPVSFLAVPIMQQKRVYGVLRCSAVKSAPYYFNAGELQTLSLIANHVGEWYRAHIALHEAEEENHWLADFIKDVGNLIIGAHGAQPPRTELSFLRAALLTAQSVLREAHSSCIRLIDGRYLKFACQVPDLEPNWGKTIAEQVREKILALDAPEGELSAAADSFNLGVPISVRDFSKYPRLFFPETKALIVTPIMIGNHKYGTIEVRYRSAGDISDYGVSAITLLGCQIGLHFFLMKTQEDLKKSEASRQEDARIQRETFENLGHQIKTPIAYAHMISDDLVDTMSRSANGSLNPDVSELHAYIRQTMQVTWNIRLFGDLAAGRPIACEAVALNERIALETIRVALHAVRMRSPEGLHFELEEKEFSKLARNKIYVDLNLLGQMIDNLLDNASKYAFARSRVVVSAGMTHQERYFYIAVANKGRAVTPEFAKTITQRGARSHQAVMGQAEGSGLGLYLVNKMLEAHNGKLDVIPTDTSGIVRFRLLFPVESGRDVHALHGHRR